jgi:3-methyladenine DNA glycosylase AlkC
MSVRECAWAAFRPSLARELPRGLAELAPWVVDQDENIRRCAIEGTRPRGVWTKSIPALLEQPELGEALLDQVKSDPSRYVQNAVANWINDGSKSRPDWAESICRRWEATSSTPATTYIVRRGLRTINKGRE